MKKCLRGEIYYADLGEGIGSEQAGLRPVVIIQNDIGNKYSTTVIVAPVTTKNHNKNSIPTHYQLNESCNKRKSIVLLEQLRVIDKKRLGRCIGKLTDRQMRELNLSLAISIGIVDQSKHKNKDSRFERGF